MNVYCGNCKHKKQLKIEYEWPCIDCCDGDRNEKIKLSELFKNKLNNYFNNFKSQ